MGMPVEPTFAQDGFRFRDAVPDPSGVNAAFDAGDTAKDTGITWDTDTLFRVRVVVKQTNALAETHGDMITNFLVQYKNGAGAWTNWGAVSGGTEDIDFASATGFADGDNTTQLFGSATFVTGDSMETDTASDNVTFTDLATTETELELAGIVNDGAVTNLDAIQIRVLYSAGDESPPATAMAETTIPTITVNKEASALPPMMPLLGLGA